MVARYLFFVLSDVFLDFFEWRIKEIREVEETS
jgi:hypothetical protein